MDLEDSWRRWTLRTAGGGGPSGQLEEVDLEDSQLSQQQAEAILTESLGNKFKNIIINIPHPHLFDKFDDYFF